MQLLCCFMLLVLLHEGGHFFFSKVFGIRVKKFCVFFDIPIKALKFEGGWKLFTFKGTDYHIGWLPLGGYVNIAGMVDETTSVEDLEKDDTPKEQMFMYKPAWQRLLVMVGGVLVNFITALVIYSAIFYTWGEDYVPAENVTYGYAFNDEAHALGFKDGDIIVGVNGEKMERWKDPLSFLEAKEATVIRNGETIKIPMNLSKDQVLASAQNLPPFVDLVNPSFLDSIMVGGPAEKAGLKKGDQIVEFNGEGVQTWNELDRKLLVIHDQIEAADGGDLSKVLNTTVVVKRAGTEKLDTLKLKLNDSGKLGVVKHNVLADYEKKTISYNIITCVPAGIEYGWNKLCSYVSSLKYLFTKDGAKSVGSFGTIGSLFPSSWNWLAFWNMTAFISIMLAFMNFLPIPMLDGGYIFLTLLEVITRRKFSEKLIDRVNTVGFYIVIGLMGLGIFNDVARMVFHLY
ncbi:MAG: RIP metalloprotease RseP [Bacteroidales bacterium]|nr:RIP metalloprotease RseP [Bacteroidales bacterium]